MRTNRLDRTAVEDFLRGLTHAVADDGRVGDNDRPGLEKLALRTGSPQAALLLDTFAGTADERPRARTRVKGSGWVDRVLAFQPGTGAGWNAQRLDVVRGRANGAGLAAGNVDSVVSLGKGGQIVCELATPATKGITVYGNGFVAPNGARSSDPARVEVWDPRQKTWVHLGTAHDRPVLISRKNAMRPSSPSGGGDRFLLADAGIEPGTPIQKIRITDLGRGTATAPTAGFDLDAIHGFN